MTGSATARAKHACGCGQPTLSQWKQPGSMGSARGDRLWKSLSRMPARQPGSFQASRSSGAFGHHPLGR